ncbi:hypothetical protein GPALN_006120 [Globodera pallida]|nr:hypothetical protein GPALN_006120 [Globodera pallida]
MPGESILHAWDELFTSADRSIGTDGLLGSAAFALLPIRRDDWMKTTTTIEPLVLLCCWWEKQRKNCLFKRRLRELTEYPEL